MATHDGDGGGKYPEAMCVDEPNNRSPINNLQGPALTSNPNACINDWANNNMFENMIKFESTAESIHAEFNNINTFLDDVDLSSVYPELESPSKPEEFPDDIDFDFFFDFDKYYGVEESSSRLAENPNNSCGHSSSAAHPSNSDLPGGPTGSNGIATSSISLKESGTTPLVPSKSSQNSSSPDSSAPDTPKGLLFSPEDPSGTGSGGPDTRSKAATANRTASGRAPGDGALADGSDVHNKAFWKNSINGHSTDGSGLPPCDPLPRNDAATHNGPMYGSTAHSDPEIRNGPMPTRVPKMQHGITMPMHVPKMQNGVLTYNGVPIPRDFSLGSLMPTGSLPSYVSPSTTGLEPWDIILMQNDTMPPNGTPMQNFPVPEGASLMRNVPPYTPQTQNGRVPPNSSPSQNGQMSQYVLPSQNGPVSRYGHPILNGSVPSYGPSMHNGSAPQYGFPTQNDSMPSYDSPMHKAPMPPVQNGTRLPNSALMHNGTIPAYDPAMQNPQISTNSGFFEFTGGQAFAGQGGIVRAPSRRVLRRQGPSGYVSRRSNPNTQGRNLQFPNGYVNDRLVADDPEEQL
ncbi:hypothetical protein ACLOAV_001911 [Pseudogymnoascus australis]